MLEDRWREDLARRMNPGVEQTHEIILKDTVGQFQIETTRVSIGKCPLVSAYCGMTLGRRTSYLTRKVRKRSQGLIPRKRLRTQIGNVWSISNLGPTLRNSPWLIRVSGHCFAAR